MKKALSVFLVAVLLLAAIPFGMLNVAASETYISGYYTYRIVNDGAVITDVDKAISGDVVIPSTLGGYPVREIRFYSMAFLTEVTSIVVPDTVKTIGEEAFMCCHKLEEITLPDSITEIGWDILLVTPYYDNEDNWEDGVLYVDNHLIEADSRVLSGVYEVKDGTKTIARNAFQNCSGITEIRLPDTVSNIGSSAFAGCSALEKINIPEGVEKISDALFNRCKALESITIPDSVTDIGYGVFYECTALKNVRIGTGITHIDGSAFASCNSLERVDITDIGKWCEIEFSSATSNPVTFANNLYLNDILVTNPTIPSTVTKIGENAFLGYEKLESITLPDSVASIGESAFKDCTALTSVDLGDSVTSIGNYVFENCTALESIEFSDCVDVLGAYAFDNSGYYNDPDNWENDVLYIGNCFIRAKEEIDGRCDIKEGTRVIAAGAFENCANLKHVTLPNGINRIINGLFLECKSLESVVIPDSVESIGAGAFYNCESLKEINLPETVNVIEYMAFFGCKSIKELTIPSSIDVIYMETFAFCTDLNSLIIPDNVYNIQRGAFGYCESVESVYLPLSVTSIGESAFEGDTAITDVWYQGSAVDKENIEFYDKNENLLEATWHYNTCAMDEHSYSNCSLICDNCEWEREMTDAHKFTNYRSNNDATCKSLKTETAACEFGCGATHTRDIPNSKTDHKYTDASDTTCDYECGYVRLVGDQLIKEADGKYYYYKDGVKQADYEGLVKYNGVWFYVKDGAWTKSTGLVKFGGQWFYVVKGKWDTSVTKVLKKYDGKWFWIVKGKWNSKTEDLVKCDGVYFYIKGGKWNSKTATKLFEKNGTKFYIKGGKWNKATTLFKQGTKWYAIKNGKWYKGEILIDYSGKKFYCNKGYAQLSYSGKKTISGKTYTIKKGKVV